MKKYLVLSLLLVISLAVYAVDMNREWIAATRILDQMTKTSFPNKVFDITDYGARQGGQEVLVHQAINKAIEVCHKSGGGKVRVPKGVFYTGPITLQSNVNLYLEEGAVLKFTTDQAQYFPPVLTRWEGIDCYNARPLIYAYSAYNIAITGKGTIDGQAANDNWWKMCGAPRYGWQEGMVSQRNGSRNRLLQLGEQGVPVHQRIMTPEDGLRPQLINFYACNTILIEGVQLHNSPFWVIHPLFCQDMIVRGVHIVSHGPNSDGCDPESSSNVLIEDCYFDTGDDCIAIKSGRNADGRKWNVPSENIVVRNCKMKNGHGGVVVGSEISGGFRNLFVENCEMDSPELDRVIRIKTSTCRGGIIENIFVRNLKVGQCKEAVLKINLQYENKEECDRSYPPIVRNVHLENVVCNKSGYGVLIEGLDNMENVYDISVKDLTVKEATQAYSVSGARGVVFDKFYANGKLVKAMQKQ